MCLFCMCTQVDDLRTLWTVRDPEYIHILEQIRQLDKMMKKHGPTDLAA